ncbi:farnesol dehydrogenase-like [Trichogramma pretiosum]|uniref:farnesol dehydrogenase-like n=1 Tax=Trichogramma pretiosum TaxID=7493 RepID=UPI0006C94E8C|nr:farnesol dehydrogenase-like [Trichogramma pretiosum]
MDRWRGKIAVVTGASVGIGLATAKVLVREGMIVVGFARRKTLMEDFMKDVKGSGKFFARECDITNEKSVIDSLNWVKTTLGSINVLINNAGAIKHTKIEDTATEDIEHIIKVNVLGLVYCSKQAIKLMKENQNEGHIININSVLGHMVPMGNAHHFSVYPASKFAVTALSETLKNELVGTKIRVTSVSPGLVKTNMMEAAAEKNPNINKMPALSPEDIAESIVHVLGVPSHVEINEIQIQAKS